VHPIDEPRAASHESKTRLKSIKEAKVNKYFLIFSIHKFILDIFINLKDKIEKAAPLIRKILLIAHVFISGVFTIALIILIGVSS
jgi:hypothetical protein